MEPLVWISGSNSSQEHKTPGAGGHRNSDSTSFAAIGATLVPTVLTAAAYIILFLVLRSRYPNIYTPRTYFKTIPEKDRTPSTRADSRKWYYDFFWLDDKFLLRHHSLEGYLFLRFFRVIILVCFIGCCLTWPILFPVNATGGGHAKQLDRISFSNATGKNRFYAHAIVAWLFVVFVCLVVTRERMFLVGLRQAYMISKRNAFRLSSRTVLFLAVPVLALKKENLQHYFGSGAQRSWVVPKLSTLEDLIDKRDEEVYALEAAEVELAKNVNSQAQRGHDVTAASNEEGEPEGGPDPSVRPKTRKIPLVGAQVDAIDLHLHKLPDILKDIESRRDAYSKSGPRTHGAIFVEFKDQMAAYEAYQSVRHHSPLALQPRHIGVQPKEVLWKNLALDSSVLILYGYVSTAVFVATILLWSIPVSFIGTISNIQYLTDKVHWLNFIYKLPDPILSFLTGFVPPYLLSTLVSYVPYFFRWVSKKAGSATTVDAEERTQKWYFAFSVVQIFLITTFSSGAAAVATQIAENPKIIPQLLADNLPKASNFYLSYFIIQGTASAAQNIINYSDVYEYIFYDKVMDKTPRQKYDRLAFMRGVSWGSVYPKFANLTVIAIAYSCIAPLMLGFATIGFYLYYLSYRYNLFYTKQVKIETKGHAYGRALQHLLVGVYLLELCLFGLLGAREATGPSVLVLILFLLTILYHITVNKYLTPLEKYMPMDVLNEQNEEQPLLSAEEGRDDENTQTSKPMKLLDSLAGGRLPPILFDPLASVLEPSLFASHESLVPWLTDDRGNDDQIPEYSEEDMNNAYLHPALTSKAPKIWLVKDPNDVSKWEIEKNKAAGLTSTDEGAELDRKNHIKWDKHDFSKAPIFKTPKQW